MSHIIRDAIVQLGHNPLPRNTKKMRDAPDYYRLRIGQYRVVYHFKKRIEIITIIKIRHRKDVYK